MRKAEKNADSKGTAKAASLPAGWLFAALDRLGPGRALVLVSLLAVAAYSNALAGDFVFDDDEQIVGNQAIRSWDNLGDAFKSHVWAFRERPETLRVPTPPPYYRPMFTILLTVEYHLFGLWPQGWHLMSIMLHILSCAGVYYVLLMLGGRCSTATLGASLFAVHPVHAESVSWISGVTDPLFTVFFLPSLYYYLKFRVNRKRIFLVVSLSLFILAAFSKETALSLVVMVFLFELVGLPAGQLRPGLRDRLVNAARWSTPYLAAAALYLAPRYLVLGGLTWENPHAYKGPTIDVLLTLPGVICKYLWHLIWPVGLTVAYKTQFVTSLAAPEFWAPAALLAAITACLVAYRKRINPQAWYGLLLLFVPLMPVLDLRQLAEEYLVFDRYLYVSVAGWSLLLVVGLERLSKLLERRSHKAQSLQRLDPASVFALALVVGLTAANAGENRSWADSYALWSNAARVTPEFWAAHYNAGLALIERKQFDEALDALNRAARLAPTEPSVFDAMGRTYDLTGDSERATVSFKRAIDLDPTMFESINNLGTIHFKKREYDAAARCFSTALGLKPQALAARFNLGLSYARMGRYSESAAEFEQVLERAPDDAETFYQLGEAYKNAGRVADSLEAFKHGLAVAKSEAVAEKISERLASLGAEAGGK